MSAKEILKMIETADKSDNEEMDRIDGMAHVYLNPSVRVSREKISPGMFAMVEILEEKPLTYKMVPRYTRSRDVLKANRPEGWAYACAFTPTPKTGKCKWAKLWKNDNTYFVSSADLPTEELAELHAIIQAIAHERGETNE